MRDHVVLTIVLDKDEDAYRIGYGEPEALELLHASASKFAIPLRCQAGLRLGLLVHDDERF